MAKKIERVAKVGEQFIIVGVASDNDWHGALGTAVEVETKKGVDGNTYTHISLDVDGIVERWALSDLAWY